MKPAPNVRNALLHAPIAAMLLRLAWPVLVGQLAVLAFSTIDTVLVARYSSLDLAAFAVGAATYITVFIGLMGVVLAVGPIVGQLYGAKRLPEAGDGLHQAVWLSLGLSFIGSLVLAFPYPFLALAGARPEVEEKVRGYLLALAFSLPASLLFTAYRGFNVAVSRPKAVMALQLGALALKIPLSAALVFGFAPLAIPSLGVTGCGVATLIAMWVQAIAAYVVLQRDPFYARFELRGRRLRPLHRPSQRALLKLGVPMGLAILIEVTGFSMMAIFISRLGSMPVAGHQIAANLVSVMFMVPLALSNATSTLVAQRVGASDMRDARRLGWHGMLITIGIAVAMGSAVYLARASIARVYTPDPVVIAATLPLLAFVVVFHAGDAAQTIAAFVLRAYRIATVPLVIYAVSLWGIGLGGGYVIAFDLFGITPAELQGARGFWFAATIGVAVAGFGLGLFLIWVLRQQHTKERATLASQSAAKGDA